MGMIKHTETIDGEPSADSICVPEAYAEAIHGSPM